MCWTKTLWPRFVNGADLKYNYCYEGRNNWVRSRIKKAILRKNFKYRQTKKTSKLQHKEHHVYRVEIKISENGKRVEEIDNEDNSGGIGKCW